ncbi:hypothetical protein [Stigmatella aurantiaca]|uniref:Uncharacterized protein n=1 Tax=Stigmatella aurantiaca (strain DW4/3-1) TaxID=378806 RepID=Q090I2_STIAD|nr:hypothetical protein [Stigmatella aurantiaca]ADO70793.1 uncharacterized protein STAUR_3001 [Stigmatella aurantiaca DW4/3-1]EAU66142.1 hypothetical protein STIAU_4318 [Stigmatella aurantiaca DW4/3-1]
MELKLDGFLKRLSAIMGRAPQGIAGYARSPLGQKAQWAGLSQVTAALGSALSQGLGPLSQLRGPGKLLSAFSGFASRFLGLATHLLSRPGLNGLWGFVQRADSSRELLGLTQQLMAARRACPAQNPTTELMANRNIFQLVAYRHAQTLRQPPQAR